MMFAAAINFDNGRESHFTALIGNNELPTNGIDVRKQQRIPNFRVANSPAIEI